MPPKLKKALAVILIVAFVAVCAFMMFTGTPDHIEDTNGADTTLQEITDEQIAKRSLGARNIGKQTGVFNGMVEISSNKFTGVYEVFYTNYVWPSDFDIQIYDFAVESGNFKMCVVNDGEIVATLTPDALVEYRLENVSGTLSLVIAGESARFSFKIPESDYDWFEHPE